MQNRVRTVVVVGGAHCLLTCATACVGVCVVKKKSHISKIVRGELNVHPAHSKASVQLAMIPRILRVYVRARSVNTQKVGEEGKEREEEKGKKEAMLSRFVLI